MEPLHRTWLQDLLCEMGVPDGVPQEEEPVPSTPPQPIIRSLSGEDPVETLSPLVHDFDLEVYLEEEDPLGTVVYREMCREAISYEVSHYSEQHCNPMLLYI